MNERDKKVYKFVSMIPCYSNTIQMMFYPSQRVANRHLKHLCDYEYLKRYRPNASVPYFYYKGQIRSQKEHLDIMARTYYWVEQQGYEIIDCYVQKVHKKSGIKPDLLLHVIRKSDGEHGFIPVEVELGNSNLKYTIKKYNNSGFNSLILVSYLKEKRIESEYINKITNICIDDLI
jgi:hypothetical protein